MVPNIGTIGLGIAKAGADIITLSGFEGGTGAARQHALRHVGLPSDIGTRLVHQALMEAGIRNRVEIWADGGYRHAHDIVKLICMGANRIGFGTLAMVSLGCTICRGCQLDTCHVGIATQIETPEAATAHGLKKFTPQEVGTAADNCARFFAAMGEEVRELTAELGYERTQDLVGRYDLLEQVARRDAIDLGELLTPLERVPGAGAGGPAAWPRSEPVEARAEAGLVRARPIRMEPKQASAQLAELADQARRPSPGCGSSSRAPTDAHDRVLGTELAGAIARARIYDGAPEGSLDVLAELDFNGGSVAGQGFGAFNAYGLVVRVEGGAQDGVGKAMLGGTVSILKGRNRSGERVNGSVGKSFAYGAQRGRLFVQGSADSRFCIRLSGADVVLGGEPAQPLDDARGLHRRPRQREGLRVRVHDLRARRRPRRHRPVGLRRDDRRPRLRAPEPRVEPRSRVDRSAGSARGPRSASSTSTPRACSTSRTCSATTPPSCGPPIRKTEAERVLALAAPGCRALPDDHPGEGPGGPEHLDRVTLSRPGAGGSASPARASRAPRRRPSRAPPRRSRRRRS